MVKLGKHDKKNGRHDEMGRHGENEQTWQLWEDMLKL
jgi:hypothetical protein